MYKISTIAKVCVLTAILLTSITVLVLMSLYGMGLVQHLDRFREECLDLTNAPEKQNIFAHAHVNGVTDQSGGAIFEITIENRGGYDGYVLIEGINPRLVGYETPVIFKANSSVKTIKTVHSPDAKLSMNTESSFAMLPAMGEGLATVKMQYPVNGVSKIIQADGVVGLLSRRITHTGGYVYAVDILADMGSTVLSGMSGVVVYVVSSYPDLGCDLPELLSRSNLIVTLNDDGSETVYGHLMQNSIRVTEGQRVVTGEPIARIGNSGKSKNPHLHLHVGGLTASGYRTLPIEFSGCGRQGVWKPELGRYNCD